MTKTRAALVAVVLLLRPAGAASESRAGVLEFQPYLEQVLSAHPALEATRQEIEGAKADLLASQGAFDPVLKGETLNYPEGDYSGSYANLFVEQPLEWMGARAIAGYRRGGGKFPIYEDYYSTNSGGETRAGIELPVLRDGVIDRRRAAIARAFVQVEGAELSLTQRRVELARAASLAFWDWVAATLRREAYEELLETAELRDRQFERRANAGELARFDKVDNERQVLQRRAQLLSSERSLAKAAFDLGLFLWTRESAPDLLGARSPPSRVRVPPASVFDLKKAVEVALAARPEHRRLENQLRQQEVEANLAQNQLLPRLDLQLYAADDMGSGSTSRDEPELKGGVKVEIPLATRTQRGRIAAVAAKRRELEAQKTFVEQRIATEVADALNAVKLAASRVEVAREEVRVAEELERGEMTKFEQGESNLIFVNLREQATVDAKVREIDAVNDVWKSYVAYRTALGETSPEALGGGRPGTR